jgi:hypothetical protein
MEALALIDHPGVVGVLDAGAFPDWKPFLVMQFVDGVNLRSRMSAQGMDPAPVARQTGHALTAAHDISRAMGALRKTAISNLIVCLSRNSSPLRIEGSLSQIRVPAKYVDTGKIEQPGSVVAHSRAAFALA